MFMAQIEDRYAAEEARADCGCSYDVAKFTFVKRALNQTAKSWRRHEPART
jgi:hypothetical protein